MTTTQIREATVLDEINTHRPPHTSPDRDRWNADFVASLADSAELDTHVRKAVYRAMVLADRYVRASQETAVHRAAESVTEVGPFIASHDLALRLGHNVDIDLLCELTEALHQTVTGEDHIARSTAFDRRDDLVAVLLKGGK